MMYFVGAFIFSLEETTVSLGREEDLTVSMITLPSAVGHHERIPETNCLENSVCNLERLLLVLTLSDQGLRSCQQQAAGPVVPG
jgi:hypothetical protein